MKRVQRGQSVVDAANAGRCGYVSAPTRDRTALIKDACGFEICPCLEVRQRILKIGEMTGGRLACDHVQIFPSRGRVWAIGVVATQCLASGKSTRRRTMGQCARFMSTPVPDSCEALSLERLGG